MGTSWRKRSTHFFNQRKILLLLIPFAPNFEEIFLKYALFLEMKKSLDTSVHMNHKNAQIYCKFIKMCYYVLVLFTQHICCQYQSHNNPRFVRSILRHIGYRTRFSNRLFNLVIHENGTQDGKHWTHLIIEKHEFQPPSPPSYCR